MPCKHQGGSDPCVRYKIGRQCIAWKHNYLKKNRQHPGGKASPYAGGKAAELAVEADLLWRGLLVTRPSNPDVPDDLHVKIGRKWYTIQVRACAKNIRTGTVYLQGASSCRPPTSDLLALVIGWERVLEYRPCAVEKVPRILR